MDNGFKKRLVMLLVLTGTFVTIGAIAQQPSLFSTSPKKSNSGVTPSPPSQSAILSPSDFNNQVSQITAKNQADFQQQLTQKLAQVPPATVPTVSLQGGKLPSPQTTTPTSSSPAAATPPLDADESGTATTTITEKALSNTAKPTTTPSPRSYSTTPPTQNNGSAAPYSGFGTGSSSNSNTAPKQQQNNSAGWNIRY